MFYSEFADDYEKIFPFRENIYSFLKNYLIEDNQNILDIGCATGHYCGEFSKAGYNVQGIDLDREMIKNAEINYPGAQFSVLNLTDITTIKRTFDLVYSTGNVLAHVSEKSLKKFIYSLKVIMKKKSIWIFQVINWDYILKLQEFDFPVIETETKKFIRKYSEISVAGLIFHTELHDIISGKTVFTDDVKMFPISSETYIQIHEKAGFKLLEHFADYSRNTFSSNIFSADIYVFSL